ncbi:MAG: DNA-processing protein DprA [Candidatus Humimicrobiaceae bacterium]
MLPVYEINKNIIHLIFIRRINPYHFIKTFRQVNCILKTINFFKKGSCDFKKAEKILDKIRQNDIKVLNISDDRYPEPLKKIDNPPPIFFYKGDKILNSKFNIAIVGTRNCSSYGIKAAKYFAKKLSRLGITVISGMARGIDYYAQSEALKESGGSIGVLGCGINIYYPKSSAGLYKTINSNGSLISEYLPFEKPKKWYFPYRNRIISGLSRGVLIIESGSRGGALITADYALKQNREVFAVPGNIFSNASRGCHGLIKQGAKLVENADDLLEEFYYLCKNKG